MQRATFETELEQHKIDCLASHGDISNWRFLKKKVKSLSKEELRPTPLLTGRDVLALGYSEGPLVGKILKALEVAQLERVVSTRGEAIEFVRKYPSVSSC